MGATCREIRGCPASLYMSKHCPHLIEKNCWEIEKGCPNNSLCKKECSNCSYYPPELKA